ncbi:hypothetical protein HG535_0A05080 [Zygotorulaspora mrakii]|uniref:Uncharacterized protein n=1 Tax=Zygotorulaspora mrakii TaxID=42260 RepID=A0A7H9AWP7_ZYGMR|nr:uncharacterized protein HG535_0A05080 [Zygotorulaspora mrakii]QLG70567.1 hypothetical protein HG535_0A05080 [Zygotorulaspora mrakii]
MSRIIYKLNELKELPPSTSVRYRVFGKLLEIEEILNDTHYVCQLVIGCLEELYDDHSYEVEKCSIDAIVGYDVYKQLSTPLQDGCAIDAYIGIVTFKEIRMFEVLNVQLLTLEELRSLRLFTSSQAGRELF